MALHPDRKSLFRVWLGEGLSFRPGPSFRTLQDATRFAMAQEHPDLCSVECPDGSWVSPARGMVREVLAWVEPQQSHIPRPNGGRSQLVIDDELRRYLAEDEPVTVPPSNRRSSRRIRVQHRAELVLNPGRVLGAKRPLVSSMVADASETGLGLRLIAVELPLVQPNDPLWVRIEDAEQIELPARIAWCRSDAMGLRIRLFDTSLEDRYQSWLRRAAFASRLREEM